MLSKVSMKYMPTVYSSHVSVPAADNLTRGPLHH